MTDDKPLAKKLHTEASLTRRIHHAIRILEEKYYAPPTAQELAEEVGISVSHFHSTFKKIVGESMAQHCMRLRIERAAALLRYSAWDIGEIGGLCGFQTHASFSRRFKSFYDQTPRQYREQHIVSPFLQGNLRQKIIANRAKALNSNVQATLSEWPEMSMVCLRFYGPVHKIHQPWKKMLSWLQTLNVELDSLRYFGLWFDGWESIDHDKYRYECAVLLPPNLEVTLPHWAYRRTLAAGTVACATTSGNIQHIERDWLLFSTDWFPYSNYQPRGEYVLDEYPHQLVQGPMFTNFVKMLTVGVPITMCIPAQLTPTLG